MRCGVFGEPAISGCGAPASTVTPAIEATMSGVIAAAATAFGVNPSSTSHNGVGLEYSALSVTSSSPYEPLFTWK